MFSSYYATDCIFLIMLSFKKIEKGMGFIHFYYRSISRMVPWATVAAVVAWLAIVGAQGTVIARVTTIQVVCKPLAVSPRPESKQQRQCYYTLSADCHGRFCIH